MEGLGDGEDLRTTGEEKLATLHTIELQIQQLLQLAGTAVRQLSNTDFDQTEFETSASEYFSNLESIRNGLREVITTTAVSDRPFQLSTYLEEKQFELYGTAASLAEAEIANILQLLPDAAIEPRQ